VARYGGEEFAVLLVNTDRSGAGEIAERIRAGIEALPIEHEGTTLHITVSIGVFAGIIPRTVRHHIPLTLADEALYKAKDEGRNRVVLAEPLTEAKTEKRRTAQPPTGRRRTGKKDQH
jgi:diguanylate cyclase (GGDEF)-like protein